MPGVGKTAQSHANCPPLANFFLSYTLKIEKPGMGKRQSGTATGGQLPTPTTPKDRPCPKFISGSVVYRIISLCPPQKGHWSKPLRSATSLTGAAGLKGSIFSVNFKVCM